MLGSLGKKLYPYLMSEASAVNDEDISKTKGARIKNDNIAMNTLPIALKIRSFLYIMHPSFLIFKSMRCRDQISAQASLLSTQE